MQKSELQFKSQNIPSDWEMVRLGDYLEEKKIKNRGDQKLPVYSVSNVYGFILSEKFFDKQVYSKNLKNYKFVERGDFAYNPARINVGSIGLFEKEEPGLVSPMYVVFRISRLNDLLSKFLFTLLKSPKYIEEIKHTAMSRGSVRRILAFDDLCNFQIPLPPLSEQKKIVYVLDSIQEAVRVQEKIIEKTKELKKVLLNEIFNSKVKNQNSKLKFKIQKWDNLKNYCYKPEYGYTANATDEPVGPKFLRITDIQDDKVNWKNVPYCECTQEMEEKYKLHNNDILIARIGATTGKTFLVKDPPKALFGSYLIRIKTKLGLNSEFLNYYFQSNHYWNQINQQKGGRLKTGINIPILQNLFIPIFSIDQQREIAEILQTIDQKIEIEQKKKTLYEELFKIMLNKLMTGEIRVNNI